MPAILVREASVEDDIRVSASAETVAERASSSEDRDARPRFVLGCDDDADPHAPTLGRSPATAPSSPTTERKSPVCLRVALTQGPSTPTLVGSASASALTRTSRQSLSSGVASLGFLLAPQSLSPVLVLAPLVSSAPQPLMVTLAAQCS